MHRRSSCTDLQIANFLKTCYDIKDSHQLMSYITSSRTTGCWMPGPTRFLNAHDFISRAHEIVSGEHDLVSRAHGIKYLNYMSR